MNAIEEVNESEQEEQVVISAGGRFADARIAVRAVVKMYLEMAEVPSISAINIDPTGSHSRPWRPIVAEYVSDVESTLRRYLMHQNDRVALRQAWNGILQEDGNPSRITTDQQRLIQALGPIFQRAGLLPKRYFASRKRTHHSENMQ